MGFADTILARCRRRWPLPLALAVMGLILGRCAPPPAAAKPHPAIAAEIANEAIRWQTISARRQTSYLKLDMPVIIPGTRITIDEPLLLNPAVTLGAGGEVAPPVEIIPTTDSAATQANATLPGTPSASQPGTLLHRVLEGAATPIHWNAVGGEIAVYSAHTILGGVEGPMVDQLFGKPRATSDAGSYLVPQDFRDNPAGENGVASRTFTLSDPMPVYLKIVVPDGVDPGEYRFRITIEAPGTRGPAAGGAAVAGALGQSPADEGMLALHVSDLAFPTDPRVFAVITTTSARLAALYPETFGQIGTNYLDRADPEHQAAVAQLDALVKAARREGLALFVEDLSPTVRVNEAGLVTVDWDAYDRVMQPYMDGTAFADRVPMAVWLAPVPPRRIRDSQTQLWQYIDACASHFTQKGWVATAAFLHPALAGEEQDSQVSGFKTAVISPELTLEQEQAALLRAQVAQMLRLHLPREMLAVTTPDVGWSNSLAGAGEAGPGAGELAIPHGQLWVVDDYDARLPPAGALATPESVREWPWMCIARGGTVTAPGVKGFVWRDAVEGIAELKPRGAAPRRPLLVVGKKADLHIPITDGNPDAIFSSLRQVWLSDGLNDAALMGILERRSDPMMVNEVLAGVVGRTGMRNDESPAPGTDPAAAVWNGPWPAAPAGFLYAGWPNDPDLWQQLPPMLERLALANDPGSRVAAKLDDPLYLDAKMWLSRSRRPVARVTGFDFSLRPGREGDILDARLQLLLENPVDAAADFDLKFTDLPGDFELAPVAATPGASDNDGIRRRTIAMAASASGQAVVAMAGHVNQLDKMPDVERLELTERHGGAVLRMPARLPIYRMHDVNAGGVSAMGAPKLDGRGDDWPIDDQLRVFGAMTVGTRYLSRSDLLNAQMRQDSAPAIIRWSYDDRYLYMLARCPQESVSDDRTTLWPMLDGRWWAGVPGGGDALQVQLAELDPKTPRVVQIAFKPAGVMLVKTGQVVRTAAGEPAMVWHDGAPPISPAAAEAGGAQPVLKYGIVIDKQEGRVTGYTVEAAIPRAWVAGNAPPASAPAWRVNVLRHRAADLASMSWSGPVVNDEDPAMMGVLLGQ